MSESNGYATFEDVFAVPFRREYIDAFAGGMKFRIRSWNARELAQWRVKNESEPETANERAIAMSCIVPPDGDLLFSMDHVKRLHEEKGGGFIAMLGDQCCAHAIADIETKKNSTQTTGGDSPTS